MANKSFFTPVDPLLDDAQALNGQSPNPGGVDRSGQLSEDIPDGETRLQQYGFTPVEYYRTGEEVYLTPNPANATQSTFGVETNNINAITDLAGDVSTGDFRFGFESVNPNPDVVNPPIPSSKNDRWTYDGSYAPNTWAQNLDNPPPKLSAFSETPHENEDPVFFGFQIIIDDLTSPLLNGEIENFISTIGGSYTEIKSRLEILQTFRWELSKYFQFSSQQPGNLTSPNTAAANFDFILYGATGSGGDQNIFNTKKRKFHYVRAIDGLDKLVEANTPKATSAFIKYREDTIKISFYEDINLSTGTLASLYKLLYWSRLTGKNIIPENLLRFDCSIIVSELRNMQRVRKSMASSNSLDVLVDNLSRYVYRAYECQLFFPKMTHPATVDLGKVSFSTEFDYDIEISFKYSDMIFERFVPQTPFNNSGGLTEPGSYISIYNSSVDPQTVDPADANSFTVLDNSLTPVVIGEESTSLGSVNGLSGNLSGNSNSNLVGNPILSSTNNTLDSLGSSILDSLDQNNMIDSYDSTQPTNSFSIGSTILGTSIIQNLKNAANDAIQQEINSQVSLLNSTLNKITSAFGIYFVAGSSLQQLGANTVSPPTNVYVFSPPSTFYDIRNQLASFAGDVLTNLIAQES